MIFYCCLIQFCVLRNNSVFLYFGSFRFVPFCFVHFCFVCDIYLMIYRDAPFNIHSDSIRQEEFCWNDPLQVRYDDLFLQKCMLFLFNFAFLFMFLSLLFFTNTIVFFSVCNCSSLRMCDTLLKLLISVLHFSLSVFYFLFSLIYQSQYENSTGKGS